MVFEPGSPNLAKDRAKWNNEDSALGCGKMIKTRDPQEFL
jgi:hypothetical protein